MAARRYFRKGDADLPSRGSFVYRGTQVVTGAEARQVKEDEARRRSAAHDLLRPRPGTKPAPRQAFDHGPERQDRSTRRPLARPAQAPPSTPEETPDASSSSKPGAAPDLAQQATTATPPSATRPSATRPSATRPPATRPSATQPTATQPTAAATSKNADPILQPAAADAARNTAARYRRSDASSRTPQPTAENSQASRDASMGASAIIGAVAALLVTTPLVLLGGVVLARPIEPLFIALVILVAALSGAIAAAAWEAGRQRKGRG